MAKKEKGGPLPARVRCPVCGGKGVFAGAPGKDGLCECEGCKLVFVGSPPPRKVLAEERNRRFAGSWDGANDTMAREESDAAVEIMSGYFARTKGKGVPLNGFDLNVLDAVSGLGFRLREFQRYGWDVYGLDPCKEAAEYCRGCFLDVKEGWFDEAKLPDLQFDLVLFRGGFGLLPDPLVALGRLEKVLRPKGLVFVSLAGEPISGCLFHYDAETLRRLFMENGFQVLPARAEWNEAGGEEGEADGKAFAWFTRKKDARAPKAKAAAEAVTAGAHVTAATEADGGKED